MAQISTPHNVANRLLKLELQLKAYQKLHEDELGELWKSLDECKQWIAALSEVGEKDVDPVEMQKNQLEITEEDE